MANPLIERLLTDPNKLREYKLKIMRVLFSKEASNINFKVLGVTIFGAIFTKIAYEMADDRRLVKLSKSFDNGAAATYDATLNLFDVKEDDDSVFWKSYVIHEAVHAWLDRERINMYAVHNEAVAYITQLLYMRQFGMVSQRAPIYIAANKIAFDIERGATPMGWDLGLLSIRIINDSAYCGLDVTTKYISDG